jgi:hypothetical protein
MFIGIHVVPFFDGDLQLRDGEFRNGDGATIRAAPLRTRTELQVRDRYGGPGGRECGPWRVDTRRGLTIKPELSTYCSRERIPFKLGLHQKTVGQPRETRVPNDTGSRELCSGLGRAEIQVDGNRNGVTVEQWGVSSGQANIYWFTSVKHLSVVRVCVTAVADAVEAGAENSRILC